MKKKFLAVISSVIALLSVFAVAACDGNDDPGVTVTPVSVRDISSYPYTSYLPGEVFDITGLAIKVNMSNGRTGKYFDTDFTEWTHKDEPLTEDVTKITVTVPNSTLTFDIDIFVGIPADSRITVDTGLLDTVYYAGREADLSSIRVMYFADGEATNIALGDWQLFDGDDKIEDISKTTFTEGEHTLTVKYLNDYTESFSINVAPASSAVYPRRIEAEDCCFALGAIVHDSEKNPNCTLKAGDGCPASDTETNSTAGSIQRDNAAEYWNGVGLDSGSINNGGSGKGVVAALAANQNGLLQYFKFTVNATTAGSYNLNASVQPIGRQSLNGKFSVAVNGGNYKVCASDKYLEGANQVSSYVNLGKKEDGSAVTFTSWLNPFWYNYVTLAKLELRAGANEIRMRLPNGFNANIDYFEVTGADEPACVEPRLISMRETVDGYTVPADVTDKTVYLDYGQTLTDICRTPEAHPFKYTLLYLRLPDGNVVPVGGHMLSQIDYTKTGEQNVTVVCKKLDGTLQAITTFKLFISRSSDA